MIKDEGVERDEEKQSPPPWPTTALILNKRTYNQHKRTESRQNNVQGNKPDQATMRPGCVYICIDHVTYIVYGQTRRVDFADHRYDAEDWKN